MKPTAEHGKVLQHFRSILLEADAPSLLGRSAQHPDTWGPRTSSLPDEKRQCIARLFRFGEPVDCAVIGSLFPSEVFVTLEQLGVVARSNSHFTLGEYRLVHHMGLFLFCHKIAPHAKLYYGTDSLALSRVLVPVVGRVLDLCSGVGAQALVCAQTASSVTAVEIEPSAGPVFWLNAFLNGLSDKVEFISGDLYKPLSDRQFDRICSNPPFLPVAPEIPLPRYAGGGPDGLVIVRRLLEGLPKFLAPDGECQIIGSILGSEQGPNVSSLEELAVAAGLRVDISCYSQEALDDRSLSTFAATAVNYVGPCDAKEEYRNHFRRLGATILYYFVLNARHRARYANAPAVRAWW